jgi:hypothetical protein
LADAHLRREYVSHREFSSEDLSFKAAIREVDFANPFSVRIKNLIISTLLNLGIFYANMGLLELQRRIISQAIVL